MRTAQTEDGMLFNLSYDEEYDLATLCMDILSDLKTTYDDESVLNYLMELKVSKGVTIKETMMESLLNICDKHVDDFDDIILQDDESIYSQYGLNQLPIAERSKELRSIIKMAWREAWKNHPRIKNSHPNWKYLPEEVKPDEDELTEEQKEYFRSYRMKEIRRLKKENPTWSDYEIELYVKDYAPDV